MRYHDLAVPLRIAAAAGVASGAILILNAAKRADLVPTSSLTQLLAPLAEIFAVLFVTALYLRHGRRAGLLGLLGFLLNFLGLAALVGVEFVINLVFAALPTATVTDLRAGPLGVALTVSSLVFLVGTLTYCAALATQRAVPRVALACYAVGAIPVALRAAVPEGVLDAALVVMAAGVVWLGIWLWRDSRAPIQHTVSA